MRKIFLIAGFLAATLLLSALAVAQETAATTAAPVEPAKEVVKTTKLATKSYVRKVGSANFAPGQRKTDAIAASAKALAPGQNKAKGVSSARAFSRNPTEVLAKKKQMFQDIATKQKPQKPAKGYEKTYRGTPYKPTKL